MQKEAEISLFCILIWFSHYMIECFYRFLLLWIPPQLIMNVRLHYSNDSENFHSW